MNHITEFFWSVAQPFLEVDGIERSTMMGFPCLRVNGQVFASCEPKTGNLLIKLPAPEVSRMVEAGDGMSFSPAGKTFKEWVMISERHVGKWGALMESARVFVASSGK